MAKNTDLANFTKKKAAPAVEEKPDRLLVQKKFMLTPAQSKRIKEFIAQQEMTQQASERTPRWNWRWTLGLASAAAIVLLTLPLLKPAAPAIQVAMLDVAGATRGPDTNEVAQLQQRWKDSSVQQFAKAAELKTWEENWPSDTAAPITKIVYMSPPSELCPR